MKILVTLMVLLFLCSTSAFSYQGTMPPPAKKQPASKKEASDCSKVNDSMLTTSVKDKLANTPSLKEAAINVAAKDGMVILTGSVKKPTNKGLATLQARRVACVRKVENQLTIEGAAAKEKKTKS